MNGEQISNNGEFSGENVIKGKRSLKQKIKDFFANPKKRLIFIIVMGIILIALVAVGLYFLVWKKSDFAKNDTNKTNEPTYYEGILDGVKVTDQGAANRHPLAVIVENHTDARPQSGLDKASIVYEAIAEGGITRFMAVYGTYEAEKVGPVRSARTYFVDWAEGYSAWFAHCGGNIDALDKIKADKVYDLDQFAHAGPYWRETKKNVSSEHTLYTSTSKLREEAAKAKYSSANNFTIYKFKDDPKSDSTEYTSLPQSQKITINISQPNYNVVFDYDKTSNSYKRSQAGKPHNDAVSGAQLTAKNVVIMTVNRSATTTKINESGYNMTTVGSGKITAYIGGKEIKGTWKKSKSDEREIFYDEAGKELIYNRGQLWITVIPPDSTSSVETVASPATSTTNTNK